MMETTKDIDNNDNDNKTLMATCQVRPNRHIALLNQQDVNGKIELKQISTNPIPIINMIIKLDGFKVGCDANQNISNCSTKTLNNTDNNQSDDDDDEHVAFGMHIHEGSDLSYDCQSVGNHYNPFNMSHGGPNDTIRHLGDLGNIYADQQGSVYMDQLKFFDLSLDPNHQHYIVNRTIVIHNGRDDYGKNSNPASKTTGNSGVRIACCLITLMEQQQQQQQQTNTTVTTTINPLLSINNESIATTMTENP
ncbi:hypothetical protein DERP_014842 [Dermatophagoides pteronyssinus]|uniref:Superoxide dismutase [Cu-Zn] n=1 Tax=Dermatophagoides pteronyssinus TaxID=6956 RepID=A0ABQ8JAR6_DERPT|nr:hypothetical protein DERP_014842 [Dermatophagoides pteronyssinus]